MTGFAFSISFGWNLALGQLVIWVLVPALPQLDMWPWANHISLCGLRLLIWQIRGLNQVSSKFLPISTSSTWSYYSKSGWLSFILQIHLDENHKNKARAAASNTTGWIWRTLQQKNILTVRPDYTVNVAALRGPWECIDNRKPIWFTSSSPWLSIAYKGEGGHSSTKGLSSHTWLYYLVPLLKFLV